MLAFHIIIRRRPEAADGGAEEEPLASWMVHPSGIQWLEDLAAEGKATMGGNGYPVWFQARAADILPRIQAGPPAHEGPCIIGEDYVLPGGATWDLELDRERIAACPGDAMLDIAAWDQS